MVDDSAAARARIEMTFASPAQAKAIQAALAPEDKGWVSSKVEGSTLSAEIKAESLGEFLRTVDDYLGGVTAAVRASNAVAPKAGATRAGKKPS